MHCEIGENHIILLAETGAYRVTVCQNMHVARETIKPDQVCTESQQDFRAWFSVIQESIYVNMFSDLKQAVSPCQVDTS